MGDAKKQRRLSWAKAIVDAFDAETLQNKLEAIKFRQLIDSGFVVRER